MEVCVDSVESAMNAASGGATRVELCANLHEGGTTPSVGSLLVLKQSTDIPVFVMVRPRGGDFLYSDLEFEVMKKDVASLKMHCANGIVIGILTKEGDVDIPRCKELIELARPLPVTFHRAFDVCKDWKKALEDIISLGCTRVLTSGQESSALEGLATIELMVQQAAGRIKVMPGGGINEANLLKIMEGSGAKEFHSSARSSRPSAMEHHNNKIAMGSTEAPSESIVKVTDASRVSQMKAILNQM